MEAVPLPIAKKRVAMMSDEDVMRMHHAIRMVRDTKRWEEIVATFPDIPETEAEWKAAWPFDTKPVKSWRNKAINAAMRERLLPEAIKAWYSDKPKEFINHWAITYDPRVAGKKRSPKMPFLLFMRQRDLVDFLVALLKGEEHGLIEKCRDMGATWVCCLVSVWLWVTWDGAAVGWGSRKEELVDRIGDPDSIFEKIRMAIRALPPFLLPEGLSDEDHLVFMKCINPQTGATITGECGDNIGRGGRSLIYFKDESSHYARPEKIEAALADNTNIQVDLSTPNGLGNVFERRRSAGQDWMGAELVSGRANVFIMDWRDHPAKTEAWYRERRTKAVAEGLLHVFKQEVERDYAASVEGIIIRPEWIKAAIDAHLKLKLDISGGWSAGLDVADGENGDTNALAVFESIVLRRADNWGGLDTGATTRRAIQNLDGINTEIQYDSIGVGSGVKAEANRLAETIGEDGLPLLRPGLSFIPWNAGAGVLNPDAHLIPDDRETATNKAMFANFKAQAWWMVARRFENTWRAVEEGIHYEPHELISLDSTMPLIRQIEKELAQPTIARRPSDLKLLVNKTPEGSRSPNLGDAIIMAAFPVTGAAPVYPTAIPEFQIAPMMVPPFWRRGFAMKVEGDHVSVLWGAYDKEQDILYITTEHVGTGAPAANVSAIQARGKWIPGIIDSADTNMQARLDLMTLYQSFGLPVLLADRSQDAGVTSVLQRISTGRLKVISTCQRFFVDYRAFRRNEDGEAVGSGLMDCLRALCRPQTIMMMTTKPKDTQRTSGHVGDRKMGY